MLAFEEKPSIYVCIDYFSLLNGIHFFFFKKEAPSFLRLARFSQAQLASGFLGPLSIRFLPCCGIVSWFYACV